MHWCFRQYCISLAHSYMILPRQGAAVRLAEGIVVAGVIAAAAATAFALLYRKRM